MEQPTLIPGIDVSNAQPADLSDLIAKAGAAHVVVKLYQTVEVHGGRDHAKLQIASAQANGCSIGGYVWLYESLNPTRQVRDALSLATEAGIALPVLWIDVEPYVDQSCPTTGMVLEALQAAADVGQLAGLYTGKWVWDRLGNPDGFADTLLWIASYDGNPTLDVPSFGGMRVVAHQWADRAPDGTPLDMDVFLPSMAVR